jgi:hypothetical protein
MVVGEEETTSTPFSNIYPTTPLPTTGRYINILCVLNLLCPFASDGECHRGPRSVKLGINWPYRNTLEATTTTAAPTTTTTEASDKEQKDAEDFKGLVNIMLKMTSSKNLPANLSTADFNKRIVRN